jgi:hypothetical protein
MCDSLTHPRSYLPSSRMGWIGPHLRKRICAELGNATNSGGIEVCHLILSGHLGNHRQAAINDVENFLRYRSVPFLYDLEAVKQWAAMSREVG